MWASFHGLSSTNGDRHVFRDTHPKLTFSLTYIERLTAFACVSIDKVRLVQLGLPILEPKPVTDTSFHLYLFTQQLPQQFRAMSYIKYMSSIQLFLVICPVGPNGGLGWTFVMCWYFPLL